MNEDEKFQSVSCSRCNEVICYVPDTTSMNTNLTLLLAELVCWQCTQRSKKTNKTVAEFPRTATLEPPEPQGPRAA